MKISRDLLKRVSLCAAGFFAAVCLTPYAWSQEQTQTTAPIQIEADRMESSRQKNAVLFFGNVRASQDNLTINADEMTVLYAKTEMPEDETEKINSDLKRRIDKIRAKGNVKIVQGDWVAAGDTMEFNDDDRIVILAGNATAWQNQNMVSGEKIILYLNEGKSVVEGGSQGDERVKAFIYPSKPENREPEIP